MRLFACAIMLVLTFEIAAQLPTYKEAKLYKSFPNSKERSGFEYDDSPSHMIPILLYNLEGYPVFIDGISHELKKFTQDFTFSSSIIGTAGNFWYSNSYWFLQNGSIVGSAPGRSGLIIIDDKGKQTANIDLTAGTDIICCVENYIYTKNYISKEIVVYNSRLSPISEAEKRTIDGKLLSSNSYEQNSILGKRINELVTENNFILYRDRLYDDTDSAFKDYQNYISIINPKHYENLAGLRYDKSSGILLGYDEAANSYWWLDLLGNKDEPIIYVFDKKGNLVDCFRTNTFIRGMVISPKGNLYQILSDRKRQAYNILMISRS